MKKHGGDDHSPQRVLIAGAGPAGLMAALAAAAQGANVSVFENCSRPGRKILMAGGGRCNLTRAMEPREMASRFGEAARFVAPALVSFGPRHLKAYLREQGLETVTDEFGQVYPQSQRAADVLATLLDAIRHAGVSLHTGCPVERLEVLGGRIVAARAGGRRHDCDRLVVATGGASYPAPGSPPDGYGLSASVGHRVVPPRPALAGLHLRPNPLRSCAGVTLAEASLCVDTREFRRHIVHGAVVVTHKGLSGPAALDLSATVSRLLPAAGAVPVRCNLAPGLTPAGAAARIDSWRNDHGGTIVRTLISRLVPRSVADAIASIAGDLETVRAGEIRREQRSALVEALTALPLTVVAVDGFDKAMVTTGGVARDEVDPRTLESRLVEGLFFAGEVLDVDGPCGGYNLQWAFAGGKLAGRSAAAER